MSTAENIHRIYPDSGLKGREIVKEELFRIIAEGSAEAILVADRSGRCVYANSAACHLLGYSEEELTKLTVENLARPEHVSDRMVDFQKVLRGEGRLVKEIEIKKKDGSYLPVEVNAVLLSNGLLYISARDISQRLKAEEEKQAVDRRMQLVQKLESLGALAGGVAHDFNNLLMAIIGNLDLALAELPSHSTAKPTLEQALTSAQRAADLTRQMLVYSGRALFLPEHTDMSALIEDIHDLLKSSVSKNVTLRFELAPSLPLVNGDQGQLRQAILNLVTNASEAIGDRPGEVRIKTWSGEFSSHELRLTSLERVPPPGRYLVVEVADNGCGMDENARRRLFEPFFTTKFTGRGLGMSAVAGIIRGHNGAIMVESQPQKGTRIKLFFPVIQTEQRMTQPATDITRRVTPPEELPQVLTGSVLIADDEDFVRDVARRMLQDWGLNVLTAVDGEEALKIFRENASELDLVILDLTMPKMNGAAVFSELKNLNPDVKVILSSGYSEEDATRNIPQGSLAGFLQKPYRLSTLRWAVAKAFGM